ncbi:hypothetical protein ACIBJE_09735 [Micromonospora sp. NPDC050187]|uniref:hypothetical protein n=1 Tax=Micromonospora sp. NPDC050187 TaxID=3364277 RepID=UPI0037B28626
MTPSPAEPVRPARPTAVTVAFWLQLATVVVLLAMVGLTVAGAVQFDGQIDRAAARVPDADPDEVSGERFGNLFMTVLVCLPALVLAGWLAATARPVLRGGGTARVLVFVAGGAQLLCCFGQGCLGFAFLPFFLAGDEWVEPTTGPDGEPVWEESEFFETLYGATDVSSDVLAAAGGLGGVVALLLTLAVVLLLALPPGSRYFRPDEERPPTQPGSWPWPAAPVALPTYAGPPSGPANPVVPHFVPVVPPGHPVPPVYYTVPPGYLICPDPSRHLPPSQSEGPPETPPATLGS